MREWGMHIVEGNGRLFANFEMPTNENPVPQIRMCVSSASSPSAVAKSRPKRDVKEGTSNVIVGLAKWDNLPGVSFGATSSDGYQFLDMTDFGWRWTLQPIPENAAFLFTLRVLDSNGLNGELAWVGASAAAAGPARAAISGIVGKARAAATEALSPPFGRHSVAPVTDSQVEAVEDLLHVLSQRPAAPVEELPVKRGEGSAAGPTFVQEFTWCTPGWELLSGQGPKPLWTFVPEAPAPAPLAAL
uniref:Uncharacterized protein n=1 Tax=Pyrodinium bahamense TaxID=73915 RepID=A0A7S0A5W5_9DINO|mmetsp:Transcript_22870/g.63681  ORF Transcript_22870/g.63681 Transcript_22870/m.63681 type:complete len:245 (+) Transcript_22870:3-737(+)